MGLLTAIKKRLTNQYIAVIVLEDTCLTKVKRFKGSSLLLEEEKRFAIPSRERLSKEVVTYLQELQAEVEQTYIALFLNSHGQGIVPSCQKSVYEKFHIDYAHVADVCIDNRYSIYASDIDIKWSQKMFSDTGLDFLFSPFLILDNLRKREKQHKEIALYMLVGYNSMSIMILRDQDLLYGTFINYAKEEDLLSSGFEEDVDVDEDIEDDMFDEFDLDLEMEESEEIADILDDVEKEIVEKVERDTETITVKNRLFGQDLRLVKYFDASLREFYDSDMYESDFITYVKIYDGATLNADVIAYLQEQLLVEIEIVPVDLLDALLDLTKEEAESGA
jgi:hypothetical protein